MTQERALVQSLQEEIYGSTSICRELSVSQFKLVKNLGAGWNLRERFMQKKKQDCVDLKTRSLIVRIIIIALIFLPLNSPLLWADEQASTDLEATIKGVRPSSKTRMHIKVLCRYLDEEGYLEHLNLLLQNREETLSKYFKYWRQLCKPSRKVDGSSSNFKAGLPSAKLLHSSQLLCESLSIDFADNQVVLRIVIETLINHFASANSSHLLVLNEHLKGCIPESLSSEEEKLLEQRSLEEIF